MSDKENVRRIEHRRRQYRQYNLIVEQGTLLEAILERYKELNPVVSKGKSPRDRRGGLSELIRDCLCERFGITSYEPYSEYKVDRITGERLPGHDLDSYLKAAEEQQRAFNIQNASSSSNHQAAIIAKAEEVTPPRSRMKRNPAKVDPFIIYADGLEALQEALSDLSLDELKDVIKQFGLDPYGNAMSLRKRDRLIKLILDMVPRRAHKGEAFMFDTTDR